MVKIAWSPLYCHPLPEGHRFPMEKYDLIPEQLLYEGSIEEVQLYTPDPVEESTILLTHTASYWTRLRDQLLSPQEIRRMGFPLSPQLVQRSMAIAGGTIRNVSYARQHGVALNGAGGTHHAFADRGEGFCLLNDLAVAANWLLAREPDTRILMVDLDVHQGNGTARIFQDDPRVFTFSMHCEANYPLKKERSDLDLGLPDAMGDGAYLSLLRETLPRLIDQVQPDLIFYLAGVDVLATDRLGKLRLSRQGCKARDEAVMRLCKQHGIPLVISLGGGYSHHIRDIVEAHCNTFRLAQEFWG